MHKQGGSWGRSSVELEQRVSTPSAESSNLSVLVNNQTLMVYDCLICGYGVVATQEFSKLLSSVQIRVSALGVYLQFHRRVVK